MLAPLSCLYPLQLVNSILLSLSVCNISCERPNPVESVAVLKPMKCSFIIMVFLTFSTKRTVNDICSDLLISGVQSICDVNVLPLHHRTCQEVSISINLESKVSLDFSKDSFSLLSMAAVSSAFRFLFCAPENFFPILIKYSVIIYGKLTINIYIRESRVNRNQLYFFHRVVFPLAADHLLNQCRHYILVLNLVKTALLNIYMTNMTHKWNEDTTLKFVEEYRQHECLWNIHYNLYKNKQARDAAYTSIASVMNIPDFGIAEVKTKIKNLRSTYSQELKKIE
ncbi:hypothetical protein QTP88_000838 [Uroleucon formosanum]